MQYFSKQRQQKQRRIDTKKEYTEKLQFVKLRYLNLQDSTSSSQRLLSQSIYNRQRQSGQLSSQRQQNIKLKQKLSQLEKKGNINQSMHFKQKIQNIKTIYLSKIRQINADALKYRQDYRQKITKLSEQIAKSQLKCEQMQKNNLQTESQICQTDQKQAAFLHKLHQQYQQKIKDCLHIYEQSNTKIKQLEQRENNEQQLNRIVDETLSNEELVRQIGQNAANNQDNVNRLYQDYHELVGTKQQIVQQLRKSLARKQGEIGSCRQFYEKLSVMSDKLNQEKQVCVDQNGIMAEQLGKIGAILGQIVGSAGKKE